MLPGAVPLCGEEEVEEEEAQVLAASKERFPVMPYHLSFPLTPH